jgi:hypothetical protein
MFDSAPPNLPVEPAPKAPVQPPQMPAAAMPVVQKPAVTTQAKKEPEDIFQGLDAGGDMPDKAMMPEFEAPVRKPPFMLIGAVVGGVLLLGAIGFAVWYFVLRTPAEQIGSEQTGGQQIAQEPAEVVEAPPPMPTEPVTTPPFGANIPAPESINQQPSDDNSPFEAPETPTDDNPPFEAPETSVVRQPIEGSDADGDGLTDAEEVLFGTDASNTDTNANSYPDGVEVGNMYDPARKGSPLANSPNLSRQEWEEFAFLMPAGWRMMTEPLLPGVATLDTGTPAKFGLQKRGALGNMSLREWLALPEGDTSMRRIQLKTGTEAYQTNDGLTTYVAVNGTIVILTYEPNGAAAYEFRSLYSLLANSLQSAR